MAENQAQPSTVISRQQPASVSEWVCSLKDGDAKAAQELWDRYFQKLIAQAEQRIRHHNCPAGTIVPEDVAASVFESLWKGANAGRFEKVTDRHELWWLLQAMTKRKVVSHIRTSTAQQRSPGHIPVSLSDDPARAFHELISHEPDAEYVLMMKDQLSFLLDRLSDDKLRQIAVLKLEGYSNEEIRKKMSISSATTTRKLGLIRKFWQDAIDKASSGDGES